MSLTELLALPVGGALIFLTLIEVSPVKVNPWGYILARIGQAINGEVLRRVEDLSGEVAAVRAELRRQEAESCQARIIRFGDELLHNTLHSKEHFDQILADIRVYELYCNEEPEFGSQVATMTAMRIKQVYSECLREHDFV